MFPDAPAGGAIPKGKPDATGLSGMQERADRRAAILSVATDCPGGRPGGHNS